MQIFLTGATGYIGSAALEAFRRAGHTVTALVRTRDQAARLAARGATGVVGNLGDPESYRDAAAAADGCVHTAFEHSDRGPEIDRIAVETLLDVPSAGRSRFVLYTSGIWVLGPQHREADEQTLPSPIAIVAWRPAHERQILDAARSGLRTLVVRPGIVYGAARGIVGELFKDARNGLMRVVGSGENRWPLVYDRDLGDLYARLAADTQASGVFHATDEGDERVIDLVRAIAEVTDTRPEIRHMPLDEARAKMGPYADALALDQIIHSPRARALGWKPTLRSVASNAVRLLEEWRRGED